MRTSAFVGDTVPKLVTAATAGWTSWGISAASLKGGNGTPFPDNARTRVSSTENSARESAPAGGNLSSPILKMPLAASRSIARCAGKPTTSPKIAPAAVPATTPTSSMAVHARRCQQYSVCFLILSPYKSSASWEDLVAVLRDRRRGGLESLGPATTIGVDAGRPGSCCLEARRGGFASVEENPCQPPVSPYKYTQDYTPSWPPHALRYMR